MLESKYLYLGLMGFTIIFPFLRSFEKKVAYYKSFRSLFTAIGATMLLFIPWDIWFTHMGIWGFNPKYLSGLALFGLPLGEWLFFIFVPFSCLFIYRVLQYYQFRPWLSQGQANMLTQYLSWLSIGVAVMSWGKWYTFSAFAVLAVVLLIHSNWLKVDWMPEFYRAYVIILIPFFIVNGVLTGTGLEEEVVWYNSDHFLGTRIGTIPLEDTFYGMSLILINVSLYEYFRKRWSED